MCKHGLCTSVQRRAIVRGFKIEGKERPVTIVSDTNIVDKSIYGSKILAFAHFSSPSTDYSIPIVSDYNGVDVISFIECDMIRYVTFSEVTMKPRIMAICPEEVFQLALKTYKALVGENLKKIKEYKNAINKYRIQFMKDNGIHEIVYPVKFVGDGKGDGKGVYNRHVCVDGTIEDRIHPTKMATVIKDGETPDSGIEEIQEVEPIDIEEKFDEKESESCTILGKSVEDNGSFINPMSDAFKRIFENNNTQTGEKISSPVHSTAKSVKVEKTTIKHKQVNNIPDAPKDKFNIQEPCVFVTSESGRIYAKDQKKNTILKFIAQYDNLTVRKLSEMYGVSQSVIYNRNKMFRKEANERRYTLPEKVMEYNLE